MPRVHRAAWVLPMDAPPIRDGWVEVDRGRIIAVGGSSPHVSDPLEVRAPLSAAEARTVVLPALVNAHTHLELSWMRGRVPPGDAMPAWADRLIRERQIGHSIQERSTTGTDYREAAVVAAIADARASGTALVGDVTNTLEACAPLMKSALSAAVFFELLGFGAAHAASLVESAQQRLAALTPHDRLRATLVPHAPYLASPDLFRAIATATAGRPMSVHLGEAPEEVRFLRDGTGPWRDLLERIGAWSPDWTPPACSPVDYIERLGLLNESLIAVHGVQFEDDELRKLAAVGATVVACPRSNRWTGAGVPPIRRFYASGVRVAIGTDSLASVADLNLFTEMAELRGLAPDVPARSILRSATIAGATALGFASELGSISPGKRAELLAVSIPAGVVDVEEYLVGGIRPIDISWLDRG